MTREDVLRTLRQFRSSKGNDYCIARIGIFGSAARDEMAEESDVDVVVELNDPDLLVLVGIKQDLEELLQRSVDVVRYRDKMNPFLKRRIQQEAIYV
jgi:hypothetical protein